MCNKAYQTEVVVNSLDYRQVVVSEFGVQITSWDIDNEGLITAGWRYKDGREGGTDWTKKKWIPILIEEQRHWPECSDNECHWVRPPDQDEGWEGKCWRHFPIPGEDEPLFSPNLPEGRGDIISTL